MISFIRNLLLIISITLSAVTLASALETTMAAPSEDVVLTVTGEIAVYNADTAAKFDLAMLQALGETTIETSTIWTDGVQNFKGVSLSNLLEYLDVSEGTLLATAINDYTVEIPVSDAAAGGPIIAYELNGKVMSVRDKGPLWVVYPYDASPDYKTEVVYSRSIWQLDRIEIVK